MNKSPVETFPEDETRDFDLVAAEIAMRQAARRARERASCVGTREILWKDGQIIEEQPDKAERASLTGY